MHFFPSIAQYYRSHIIFASRSVKLLLSCRGSTKNYGCEFKHLMHSAYHYRALELKLCSREKSCMPAYFPSRFTLVAERTTLAQANSCLFAQTLFCWFSQNQVGTSPTGSRLLQQRLSSSRLQQQRLSTLLSAAAATVFTEDFGAASTTYSIE